MWSPLDGLNAAHTRAPKGAEPSRMMYRGGVEAGRPMCARTASENHKGCSLRLGSASARFNSYFVVRYETNSWKSTK